MGLQCWRFHADENIEAVFVLTGSMAVVFVLCRLYDAGYQLKLSRSIETNIPGVKFAPLVEAVHSINNSKAQVSQSSC
jgi:hypothetical protein